MAGYDRDCPLCGSETEKKENIIQGRYRVCTNEECQWQVSIA